MPKGYPEPPTISTASLLMLTAAGDGVVVVVVEVEVEVVVEAEVEVVVEAEVEGVSVVPRSRLKAKKIVLLNVDMIEVSTRRSSVQDYNVDTDSDCKETYPRGLR